MNWQEREALNERREEKAEKLFSEYDFEPEVVEEVDGWENDAPNTLQCVYYVAQDGGPTEKRIFSVEFAPDSDKVLEIRPGD